MKNFKKHYGNEELSETLDNRKFQKDYKVKLY